MRPIWRCKFQALLFRNHGYNIFYGKPFLFSPRCFFTSPKLSAQIMESSEEAVADIRSGSTVLIGGFGICGIAENLLRALSTKPNVQDLVVISNTAHVPEFGLGFLLQKNQVSKFIGTYVGENPLVIDQYLKGQLELEFVPQGTLAERLRAGAAGIPAFYTTTGFRTLVHHGGFPSRLSGAGGAPVVTTKEKEARCFNDKNYILETGLTGDFALIKGWKADKQGNVIFRLTASNSNPVMCKAVRAAIVEVEEIVETGTFPPDQVHLPGIYVDRLVKGEKYIKPIERLKFRKIEEETDLSDMSHPREKIIRRAALEFKDGMYVNLGIGIPTMASNFLPPEVSVHLHGENGVIGLGPHPVPGQEDSDVINASKESITLLPGSSIFPSDESFLIIRGGHLDLTMLGAMEVSQFGDLANWYIPGRLIKGMGGAMDLVSAEGTKVFVTMEHVAKDGTPKIRKECTMPLTGSRCVNKIITDMGVFEVDPSDGLTLTELAEGISLEEVRSKTEACFKVSPDLIAMRQIN